ncbi:Glycosyl transferase family 2 OS=Tsukamurella paurometabola (strain ATCC 8368 / DSM / CCUG 35730/ CIP 100753 / JCM 10117 / KCTC 9821 / NBRC 16120 / NCIMB 702349 / NCTC 13040) OX=521096 GN=Tpau_1913 PE=4 SV=1 [Tsukamurella paurometabola]|uniref:Glycosyl transferase family 2 n=1 Tax=Tsukamurella paurometabola (strain ATCC 8368 / DSM 20162 / CCUG 35730 / CIP 100753 / JCM 10117 / KCTC 9821 / NBRC 16120 / NCIMB 702349 / NCTC 13040) TaxID=521096 RepID=D5UN29_TSUPD|nr:glycosyltransferase family 2 protein [Tsukamurella paurometabola]ADG78526.1 glycosyl transferase family 2 [Tsukamurella paurometabola DSM 20162]SUP32039.1 Poly-beta-1,6-N-acetyl-D-glucosamine synthase [Tsukamurella paurometabola]
MAENTFAVVIPAYNEDDVIEECLERLLAEGPEIDEIIVVDNNSSDRTVDLVEKLAESNTAVKLIHEARQGLVYARNTGLDAAESSVIARIDADTVVAPGWARRLRTFFDTDDGRAFDVVSTLGEFRGLPGRNFQAALNKWNDPLGRNANRAQRVSYCFGPSMAFRAETWHRIRSRVAMRRDIFEDVDIALCVEESGGACGLIRDVVVEVSPRRFYTGVASYATYAAYLPRTFWLHGRRVTAAWLTAALPLTVGFHAVRLAILRGIGDGGFSVRDMFRSTGTERERP